MPSNKNEWIEHLYKTFKFFVGDAEFNSITFDPSAEHLNIPPISTASNYLDSLEQLRGARRPGQIDTISIPLMEIPILDGDDVRFNEKIQEKHKGTFLIGGELKFNNNVLDSYSYTVCLVFATQGPLQSISDHKTANVDSCCLSKCGNSKRIIRRIHFDYQPDSYYPFHLQIGGEFSDSGVGFENLHYCFDHAISRPRIPYRKKFGYVSLFDYMIKEFDTPLNKWRTRNRSGVGWGRLLDENAILLEAIDN